MALNGYVILDAFFSFLGLGAAVVTVALAAVTLLRLRCGAARTPSWLEDRVYLAIQLTYAVLGLSVASWITFYLVLDDFVPLWPGAMCIYGVTRIGEGNQGITGWLPTLVTLSQCGKPLVVFATGAALVLYRLYRRTGLSQLLPRVLGALLVIGLLSTALNANELTYLSMPKRDLPVESGCCSAAAVDKAVASSSSQARWVVPAYYACHAFMVLMLWPRWSQKERGVSHRRLAALWVLALATLGVSERFVVDVAAPALLHLPYHHCVYDLVGDVPESGVALGLLLWGSFCVGWMGVVEWAARSGSSADLVAEEVRRWQTWGTLAYLGTAAMFTVELWLA